MPMTSKNTPNTSENPMDTMKDFTDTLSMPKIKKSLTHTMLYMMLETQPIS